MPDLAGNLTEVTIDGADLAARLPTVTQLYLPTGAADFAAQIAAGINDAIGDFETFTGKRAERAKAKNAAAWEAIVVLSSLLVILRAATDDRSKLLADRFAEERSRRLQNFLYWYDADLSGAIDETSIDEAPERVQEITLLR
jgi:hypothetical protein